MKTLLALLLLIFVSACSHPLEIVGKGDITSASGDRDCLLEDFQAGQDNCSKNYVVGEYEETYYAQPRSGWQFDHWDNYCTEETLNECSFDADAGVVHRFWGATVPPLVAVFKYLPGVPYADIVTVNGRMWVQPDFFTDVTWNELNERCPDRICAGSLKGYDLTRWAWASVDEVNTLFNYYLGSPRLGPGPDGFHEFNSTWLTDFLADGWRFNFVDSSYSCAQGHTATALGNTQAYRGGICSHSPDTARTNLVVGKDELSSSGAWLYLLQPLSDTVNVEGTVWAQPDLFSNFSWNQIQDQCPGGVCGTDSVLNGYYMDGWVLASVEQVNSLFNNFIGTLVLGQGPDSYSEDFGSSWAGLAWDAGFRTTLSLANGRSIEGVVQDTVATEPGSAHVGVIVDSHAATEGPDQVRSYGYHGKDEAYGFAGAWFYLARSIEDSFTAVGREWAQPELFENLSWNQIERVCPAAIGTCSGTLNGHILDGWTWASVDDANELLNAFIGHEQLQGGPDTYTEMDSSWGPTLFYSWNAFRPTSYTTTSDLLIALLRDTSESFEDRAMAVRAYSNDAPEVNDRAETNHTAVKDTPKSAVGALFYRE